jgi:hypothetical protein
MSLARPASPLHRTLAALLATAVLVAYAPPLSPGGMTAHCDHPLPPGAAAWSVPTGGTDCHTGLGTDCATMPQCAAAAPALGAGVAAWAPDLSPATAPLTAATAAFGRLALGPPTPPPNS